MYACTVCPCISTHPLEALPCRDTAHRPSASALARQERDKELPRGADSLSPIRPGPTARAPEAVPTQRDSRRRWHLSACSIFTPLEQSTATAVRKADAQTLLPFLLLPKRNFSRRRKNIHFSLRTIRSYSFSPKQGMGGQAVLSAWVLSAVETAVFLELGRDRTTHPIKSTSQFTDNTEI